MLALYLSFFSFLISSCYYLIFADALANEEWLDVNGFAKIIIPDTFLYLKVIDNQNILKSLLESGVKNTIGPSILWVFARGNWILAGLFNSIQLLFTLLYVSRIARTLKIEESRSRIIQVLVALMPATIYYSVGALKEIPTMLFLTGFFYHFLKNDRIIYLLYAFMGIVFRGQVGFVIGIFFCADLIYERFKKNHLISVLYLLLFISAIYPFLQQFDAFGSETSALFREDYTAISGVTFGAVVELIRDSIPIASIIAVLFRIFQSVFEPILSVFLLNGLFENGSISVIQVVYLTSFLPSIKYWFIFLKGIIYIIRNPFCVDIKTVKLYAFCTAFIFPVGGFSFVHHRYLYPITALLLIAGSIEKSKSGKFETL